MNRSFRYRLNPTRKQAIVLLRWLALTRELYNAALVGILPRMASREG